MYEDGVVPWRPAIGIAPQLSDAELVTLAMMQAMLGFTSVARWLRHARAHLRHLFPYLPQQPGYNKRLRKAAELIRGVTRTLARDTALWSDDVWVVDSTPVECGRSRETVKRSHLAGWAPHGYCARGPDLAGGHVGQVALPLLLGAEGEQQLGHHRVAAHRPRQAHPAAGEL